MQHTHCQSHSPPLTVYTAGGPRGVADAGEKKQVASTLGAAAILLNFCAPVSQLQTLALRLYDLQPHATCEDTWFAGSVWVVRTCGHEQLKSDISFMTVDGWYF